MCEKFTLSLIPNVATAVKTASPTHPNQDRESRGALRRSALVRISLLPPFTHRGNPVVGVFFFGLSQTRPARDHHIFRF
jgi:hypothetical protein